MEGMWTCYFPAFSKMSELISSGAIGEIVSFRGQFGFELSGRDSARLTDINLGGGALMDIGIYLLSFVYMVFNKEIPKSVHANTVLRNDVDWHSTVLLGFKKGQAVLDFGFDSAFYETQAFIVGTKGSIKVCNPFFAPQSLVVNTASGEETFAFPLNKSDVNWNFSESAGLFHEVKFMEQAIREGKLESDTYDLTDSKNVLSICDKIRKEIGFVYPWDTIQ